MLIATIVFWMGRHKFIQIPPRGWAPVAATLKGEGGWALLRLLPLYAFVAVYWALYDQTGSSWVLQAQKMDRRFLGVNWDESQIQAINPLLILILVPLFSYVVYPAVGKVVKFSPLRRVAAGFFLMVVAFGLTAYAENLIQVNLARPEAEQHAPSIFWQLGAYVVLTTSEVMVSVTCLEFSYTQAPREMKSFVMAIYLASTSVGNEATALINLFIQNADGSSKLPGASYFWFFTGAMFVTSIIFIPFALLYKEKTYLREDGERQP
jgi:POT family proton-dependent oligopeptide transporter